MEREKEIAKLVNVLRRTARMAMQSEWTGSGQDAAAFCVEQYNRVLARLKEIERGCRSRVRRAARGQHANGRGDGLPPASRLLRRRSPLGAMGQSLRHGV